MTKLLASISTPLLSLLGLFSSLGVKITREKLGFRLVPKPLTLVPTSSEFFTPEARPVFTGLVGVNIVVGGFFTNGVEMALLLFPAPWLLAPMLPRAPKLLVLLLWVELFWSVAEWEDSSA